MQEPLDVGRVDSTIPRFLFYGGLMRLLTAVRGWQENNYILWKKMVYGSFCRLKKSAMLQWVILQAENNLVVWSFQT